MTRLLILGATGQVGQALLARALASPAIERIVAPTRRSLPIDPKLENPLVEFGRLPPEAAWWQAGIAVCALGTTLRQARSRAGFYQVDHDFVLEAARLIRQAGTPVFGLVSSLGANPSSRVFYLRVKGETERDILSLAFPSTVFIRPSLLIGGPRAQGRPLEAAGLWAGKVLSGILPRRYRAVTTQAVAGTIFDACLAAQPGLQILESEFIHG
jgi:uncharacterized protein YbjT (DUF2867 family)